MQVDPNFKELLQNYTTVCKNPRIQKKANHQMENVIFAMFPPKEFDPKSWDCLFHKENERRVLFVYFPDEFYGERYRETEANEFLKQTLSDLDKYCEVISATAYPMCNVTSLPRFDVSKAPMQPFMLCYVCDFDIY